MTRLLFKSRHRPYRVTRFQPTENKRRITLTRYLKTMVRAVTTSRKPIAPNIDQATDLLPNATKGARQSPCTAKKYKEFSPKKVITLPKVLPRAGWLYL